MTDVHELGALYDRFGRAAYRLALAMLENKQSAEDAVAEGFADFWRTVSSAAAPDDAYRLLLTLVHRAAVRRARREGTTTASNCARLQAELLPELPAEQQRVIAYFGGLREREVAERLGVSVAQVRRGAAAGLARLQRSASEGSVQRPSHDTRPRPLVRERA
jgi:DNA-directed RNA polymerase specialized sigma24 family protein